MMMMIITIIIILTYMTKNKTLGQMRQKIIKIIWFIVNCLIYSFTAIDPGIKPTKRNVDIYWKF